MMRSERAKFLVRDIARGRMRSVITFVAAFLVGAVGIAAVLMSQSTHAVLDSSIKRLGADVIVLPLESNENLDKTLLMDVPTDATLPRSTLESVRTVPGVEKVSPELFLTSITGAPCCPARTVKMVIYDPKSDFAVTPWLRDKGLDGLGKGEVIGGSDVSSPDDNGIIKLYGSDLELVGNLARTGTGLDATIYMTWDTAEILAKNSQTEALKPFYVPEDRISAVLVKIADGAEPVDVAGAITASIAEAQAIGQSEVFSSLRAQGRTLQAALTAFAVVIAAVAVALVFVVAVFGVRERRREIGVLRALGATRSRLVMSLTLSSATLALSGAVAGTLVTVGIVRLFGASISETAKLPLALPGIGAFAPSLVSTIVGVCVVVTLSSALPLLRSAVVDPAEQMREQA